MPAAWRILSLPTKTSRRSPRRKWWTSRSPRCAWARAKSTWSAWNAAKKCPPPWKKSSRPKKKASSCIPGSGPKRIIGKDGKVTALETLKTKWVFDQNKRFNPAFYDNSETQIECDTIIMAIGQAPRLDFFTPEDKVELSPRGLIAVNPQTLMTSARRHLRRWRLRLRAAPDY